MAMEDDDDCADDIAAVDFSALIEKTSPRVLRAMSDEDLRWQFANASQAVYAFYEWHLGFHEGISEVEAKRALERVRKEVVRRGLSDQLEEWGEFED